MSCFKNYDGLFINPNTVSMVIPHKKLTAYGETYKIQINIYDKEHFGDSDFDTKEECLKSIRKLIGVEDVEDDDLLESKISINKYEIAENTAKVENLEKRLIFAENKLADETYYEEFDKHDIEGI